MFYQSTEQPLWGEDQIHKEDPYKDATATEPVKTHYYSPKVKAFLEKAGYNFSFLFFEYVSLRDRSQSTIFR